MSMYIDLFKTLCNALRGSVSERMRNDIMIAINSLIHRLKDVNVVSDQNMLKNMYKMSIIIHILSFITLYQSKRLL